MHVIQTAENPSPVESTSLCEYDMISPFPNSLVSLFLQSRNPMVMSNLDDTLEKVAHTALRSNNRNTKPPTRSCRTTTAKHHNRRFVVHNYHDHALDQTVCDEHVSDRYDFRGAFPMKLHDLLDYVEVEGLTDVVSWQPHGRSFAIRKPTEFVDNVMPKFFRQTRLTSFQRQLNLYGFNRLTLGKDQGAYYSEYFLKGKPLLCMHLKRTKVKGTYFKAASNPKEEPDLYSMPSLSLPDDTENDSHVSLIDRSNDDSHITCSSHGENKLSWSTLSDDHRKPLTTVAPLREFVKSNTSFEPTHLLNQSTSFEPIELKDVPFDAQIELLYTEPLLDFDPPKDSSIPNVISDATIVPSLAMGTTWGEPLDEWYDESLL